MKRKMKETMQTEIEMTMQLFFDMKENSNNKTAIRLQTENIVSEKNIL